MFKPSFVFRHDFRMLLFWLDPSEHRPINILWNCLCETEYLGLPMSASPILSCQQSVFLTGKLHNSKSRKVSYKSLQPLSFWVRYPSSVLSCTLNIPLLEHVSGQAVCLPIILLTRPGAFASRTFYLYLLNVFCFPEIFSPPRSKTLLSVVNKLLPSSLPSSLILMGNSDRKWLERKVRYIPVAPSLPGYLKMNVLLLASLKRRFLCDSLIRFK